MSKLKSDPRAEAVAKILDQFTPEELAKVQGAFARVQIPEFKPALGPLEPSGNPIEELARVQYERARLCKEIDARIASLPEQEQANWKRFWDRSRPANTTDGLRDILDWISAAEARPSPQKPPETEQERAARRQAVVMPILDRKDWTRNKLVTEAGIGKSVYEYLAGKRKNVKKENRDALADALGIPRDKIPE